MLEEVEVVIETNFFNSFLPDTILDVSKAGHGKPRLYKYLTLQEVVDD